MEEALTQNSQLNPDHTPKIRQLEADDDLIAAKQLSWSNSSCPISPSSK